MRMRDSTYDYMMSTARLDRITIGAVVEATAAAPEWCFGLTGQVMRIRRPAEWQAQEKDAPAVLVLWQLGANDGGRVVGKTCKHSLLEIKLKDGEEWDEDGDYPLAPEPDAEQIQMRMEV